MADSIAPIQAKTDVTLYEQHDIETSKFIRSLFTYFDSDNYAWVGYSAHRKGDLTIEDLRSRLRKVPDAAVFPETFTNLTVATNPLSDYFVKRPRSHCLLDKYTATLVPQMLLAEVKIMEILKEKPHPTIVPYYGCVVERGRITGIALQRYDMILDHRFRTCKDDFDVEAFEKDLDSVLRHVHSMGLAHNDINPSNIALDKDDHPKLIDWGSCQPFGASLLSAGTPGWIDEDYDVSRQDHDLSAAKKVISWVREQITPCKYV